MNRPYTAPGLGWLAAILGLVIVIVLFVIHGIGSQEALLFALAFIALLLG